jgi:hypothetical protein
MYETVASATPNINAAFGFRGPAMKQYAKSLQDSLMSERYDYQDDVLMLKFNRQELTSMLCAGDAVEIKLSGILRSTL